MIILKDRAHGSVHGQRDLADELVGGEFGQESRDVGVIGFNLPDEPAVLQRDAGPPSGGPAEEKGQAAKAPPGS